MYSLKHQPVGLRSRVLSRSHSSPVPLRQASFFNLPHLDRSRIQHRWTHSQTTLPKHACHVAVVQPSERPIVHEEKPTEPFNWFKCWYPIHSIHNLKKDRPNRLQVVGKWFAIWLGKNGEWVVMEDKCPHRYAPLSEGRIEKDGNLWCSYHSWKFDETGKCVGIPHCEDERSLETACASARSRPRVYPSKSRAGLLWVFPDDSPDAFEESKKHSLKMEDSLADYAERDTIEGDQWYTRDLPYNFDALLENLLDPSHLVISHHTTFPAYNRYTAKPLKMRPVEPLHEEAECAFEHDTVLDVHKYAHVEFRPPYTSVMENSDYKGDPDWIRQHTMIVPVAEKKCRSFLLNHTSEMVFGPRKDEDNKSRKSPVYFKLPAWQIHMLICDIVDNDLIFIREQDRHMRKEGVDFVSAKSWYIPSTADACVMGFRKWYETVGGQGEAIGGSKSYDNSANPPDEVMLDRYTQHTQYCTACKNALRNFEIALGAMKLIALGGVIAAGVLLMGMFNGTPLHWKSVIQNKKILASLAVSAVMALLRIPIQKFVKRAFFYKPFNHPDNR